MKSRLLVVFLLFSARIFSQEIKSNTVDPFTNERTIETTMVSLKQGLSGGFGISYLAINDNYYLNIVGYKSNLFSIADNDKLWLVLDDGNVIQFNERAREEADEQPEKKNVFIYHFFAKMNDIEVLKNKKVAIIRISSPGGASKDYKVSGKTTKNIQKLNDVFYREVNK